LNSVHPTAAINLVSHCDVCVSGRPKSEKILSS
jgi:hypothetical protein